MPRSGPRPLGWWGKVSQPCMEDEGVLTENEELVEGEPGGRCYRRYIAGQPIDAVRNFVDPRFDLASTPSCSAVIACSSRGMPSIARALTAVPLFARPLRAKRTPYRTAGTDYFLRVCVALHVPARSHHKNSAIARPSGAPPCTGTRTSTPSSGAEHGGTAHCTVLGSPPIRMRQPFSAECRLSV